MLSILKLHMAGGKVEEHIRAELLRLRQRRGWTQTQLAERLIKALPKDKQTWATQTNISRYEKGKLDADIDTLVALATALGVPFSRLIGPTPAPLPVPLNPLVQAVDEALATKKANPETVLALVNTIRDLAGLPDVSPVPERKRGQAR